MPASSADAALARFGLEGASTTFVREGENVTYRVDAGGRAYALRIHRPGYQTAASVRSELARMESLQRAGVATPDVVRGVSGDVVEHADTPDGPRLVALFGWVEGESFARLHDPSLWEQLGGLMARLHLHGQRFERPPGFERQAWDDEGMVGERPLWGDALELGDWDEAQARAIRAARATVRERLRALPRTPDRYGLVHGDLAFDNVLVRPDGTPVVIDFDDCGWSWYPWELAVALFPFDGEPGFDERRDALVRGYRAAAPLPDDVLAELPTFVMARRLVTLGWLFLHAHTAHAAAQREWRLRTLRPAIERYLEWAAG
jgi:Ser/Thr protein kinase RdoA (MazF antagonist)